MSSESNPCHVKNAVRENHNMSCIGICQVTSPTWKAWPKLSAVPMQHLGADIP